MASNPVQVLLTAVMRGKLTPQGARDWARRAAQGEDIGIVPLLTPAPYAERITAAAYTALANDLAAIVATGPLVAAGAFHPPGEPMTDAEADLLWPPRTPEQIEQRQAAVAAAAQAVVAGTASDLHRQLFGTHTYDAAGAEAAAGPGHVAFVGSHTHAHPAYQQGDAGSHTHAHHHAGDANHDHAHPG
jgi:hypothetical protein